MSRVLAGGLLVVAMAAMLSVGGRAARDLQTMPLADSGRELIVFETDNCIYCGLFRRDVLPDYLKSKRAAEVPIRFVDVAHMGALEQALSGPLTVVPTVVLMNEGREVARIAGYTGPENFFHMVSHILGGN